jgi:hypothetical protein
MDLDRERKRRAKVMEERWIFFDQRKVQTEQSRVWRRDDGWMVGKEGESALGPPSSN